MQSIRPQHQGQHMEGDTVMADQIAEAQEISEMDASHTVDNGESKRPDEVTPKMMWRKLQAIQQHQREIEERLEKIERNTKPAGGSQPQEKFSTKIFFTEAKREDGKTQVVKNDLGKSLNRKVEEKGQLDKNGFEKFMSENGWTASSTNTILSWMKKTASRFTSMEYKVGENGGSNKPSRIVWRGY